MMQCINTLYRCRRLQLALIRSLFILQDQDKKEITRNRTLRDNVFTHLLFRGWDLPPERGVVNIKSSKVSLINGSDYRGKGGLKGKYVGMEMSGTEPIHILSTTVSPILNSH